MPFEPERIAKGATAEVYSWEGERVLKLLKADHPAEAIQQEARKTRAAHEAGLPAPRVSDRADFGERHGWLFERIRGPLLIERLIKTGDVAHAAEVMSTLHARLHGTHTRSLPDLTLRLRQHIGRALLDETLRLRALTLLEHLPEGDSFCHGDFHPGNIIMSRSGPVLIDWHDATRGHALADVACTLVLIGGFPHGVPPAKRNFMHRLAAELHDAYLDAYCTLTRASPEAILPWVVPVAAARLAEGHKRLHAYLTDVASGKPLF